MNKALRVFVILLLLLSIGALTLGTMLFMKRELLKGRTQKLENTIVQLGTTIEAEPATLETKPQYPAKDVSDCTAEILDTPQLSDFWDRYKAELETRNLAPLELNKRRLELMTYYKMDLITGRVARDPATGYKLTTGEGTMQAVLDDLLAKAEAQLNRLNETRQQLANVRAELVATITEQNNLKKDHRQALKKIKELEAEIEQLKAKIAELETKVKQLEDEKKQLEDKVAEQQKDITRLEATVQERDAKIEEQSLEIKRLRGDIKPTPGAGVSAVATKFVKGIEPGPKGKVIAVNAEWNFVVIELTDAFMQEIFKDPAQEEMPVVELMVKREAAGGQPEKFVTKVKIIQIKKAERLGIADIMADWQQVPVEKGDVAFY